jgi:hypothetical protein
LYTTCNQNRCQKCPISGSIFECRKWYQTNENRPSLSDYLGAKGCVRPLFCLKLYHLEHCDHKPGWGFTKLLLQICKIFLYFWAIKSWDYFALKCFFKQISLKADVNYCINVRDYLNGIHDIQDKTPCIALTLFKHENGRVELTKGPLNPFVNCYSEAWSKLSNTHDQAELRRTNPFEARAPQARDTSHREAI